MSESKHHHHTEAASSGNEVGIGQHVSSEGKPNELVSKNGAYRLIVQEDGNLCLYAGNQPHKENKLWQSDTHGKGKPPYALRLLDSGNLVLFDASDNSLWHTGSEGKGAKRVILTNTGNLTLVDENNDIIWQSATSRDEVPEHEKTVPPNVNANFEFTYGAYGADLVLKSKNGGYFAFFWPDGRFSLYNTNHFHPKNEIWYSEFKHETLKSLFGHADKPVAPFRLRLQEDANLVIYDSKDLPFWATHTKGKGIKPHRLTVQDDGNMVLYDGETKSTWDSDTRRK